MPDLPARAPDGRAIETFWLSLVAELESRLAKGGETNLDGSPIRLIACWRASAGGKQAPSSAIFDMHTLRVIGLTALIDAGVPITIVSEFVAERATFLMTWYYYKPSAAKATRALNDGMQNRATRAYSAEYGDTQNKESEYSESDDFLFWIPDLRTAARVRELLADDRSKERQINRLKNFISNLAPFKLNPDGSFALPEVNELAESAAHQEFSPMEIDSVVSFLKAIEESGECLSLRFDPTPGALLWKEGVLEVACPGFLHALLKIANKES